MSPGFPRFSLSNTSTVSAQTLLTTIQTGGKAVSEGQVMGTSIYYKGSVCVFMCLCVWCVCGCRWSRISLSPSPSPSIPTSPGSFTETCTHQSNQARADVTGLTCTPPCPAFYVISWNQTQAPAFVRSSPQALRCSDFAVLCDSVYPKCLTTHFLRIEYHFIFNPRTLAWSHFFASQAHKRQRLQNPMKQIFSTQPQINLIRVRKSPDWTRHVYDHDRNMIGCSAWGVSGPCIGRHLKAFASLWSFQCDLLLWQWAFLLFFAFNSFWRELILWPEAIASRWVG